MRVYLPMKRSELSDFLQKRKFSATTLIAPTLLVAQEYGVSELEEIEYAALEIARTKSENDKLHIITTFELPEALLNQVSEIEVGILLGSFILNQNDLVAIYRVTSADEELEWYDASEVDTILEVVGY
jgi:hypothetical protein